jgi:glutathione S-transferase
MLELYQYEECPYCQIVRRKLTELGLDYICRNAPWGRPDKDHVLQALSGDTKVPFLVDPDEGVYLADPREILRYLDEEYGPRVRRRLATLEAARRGGTAAADTEEEAQILTRDT